MNFNKKLAVAVSGAVLLMAGQFALADSATDIVDALVSKGVLTEEEGKLITKGHTSKTAVTPVVKEKDGAFTLESANGRNSISLTGRMHLDYRFNDGYEDGRGDDRDTQSLADQFELRRARLGVKGKFANDFKYEIVGNLPGTATIDVAFLDWAKYDAFQIRTGKFKQPFGLEQLTSSNNIALMERSYVDQLVPAKKLGLQVMGSPKAGFTYALSTFQPHDTELNISGGDRASGAARGTVNFAEIMGNKEAIMHVGVAVLDSAYTISTASTSQTNSVSDTQRGTISSFRTPGRGLNNVFRGQVNGEVCSTSGVSGGCTSEFSATVRQQAYGLEGIYATGPFKVVGEYSMGDYRGSSQTNVVSYDTKTYYVEAGYFITGEKYASSYKNGVFSSFKPTNDFDLDKNNWGAIEALFRFEGYDVDDVKITQNGAASSSGGRVQGNLSGTATNGGVTSGAKTYTGGVRWILNPNVVIKGNYSYTKFDNAFAPIDVTGATAAVKDEKLLMFRTQFMF
ncbi:MAG: porin [Candidatus Methylopumilus sp.]|nr:porin [Candidatus Methylopumilus sp.]